MSHYSDWLNAKEILKRIDQPTVYIQIVKGFPEKIFESMADTIACGDISYVTNDEYVDSSLTSGDVRYFFEEDKELAQQVLNDFISMACGEGYELKLKLLPIMQLVELAEGRFIYYAPMTIYKTDKFDKKLKYTKSEYTKRMKPHYDYKVEAIHIMGEYAKRLQKNYEQAMTFLKDYFTSPYNAFKRKYKLLKDELLRPMTRKRYEKIFNRLSDEQKQIIEDKESKTIMILAGPGSGKTKVLVHKIASLILKEDVKPDQFLMLTYSRTAVAEFKSRLYDLIGSMAYDVDIYTFHSYALQLIGRQVQ